MHSNCFKRKLGWVLVHPFEARDWARAHRRGLATWAAGVGEETGEAASLLLAREEREAESLSGVLGRLREKRGVLQWRLAWERSQLLAGVSHFKSGAAWAATERSSGDGRASMPCFRG